MFKRILLSALLLVIAPSLFAQRVEPLFVRDAVGEKRYPPAPQIARQSSVDPLVTLGSSAVLVPEEIEGIRAWNAAGKEPMKNGFTRRIPDVVAVRISPRMYKTAGTTRGGGGALVATDRGTIVWSAAVRVESAHMLRLHLTGVSVPPGSTFWVYGTSGDPIAFDSDLVDPTGGIYTPIVEGPVAYLEFETPAAPAVDAVFTLSDVVEIVRPAVASSAQKFNAQPADSSTCLIDATCVTSATLDVIAAYRKAVAHLEYVDGGSNYVCTGGLLNDTANDSIPYMLTANHCFSTQTVASSLDAFWDYQTSTCGGSFPSIASMPRSSGSTLLATSATSDFTFVRLSSVPSGRYFLGWDSRSSAITSGTVLHRVSHPFPEGFAQPAPQVYSYRIVDTSTGQCATKERPNFIYSTGGEGGTYGGSSGSPVILSGGYVVGQLFGLCGQDPTAGCDNTQGTVDGALSASWSSISQYLQPGSGTPTVCTPGTTTACVLNNRFQVKVRYRNGFDNNAVDTDALVKSVTGFASSSFETAFFYFNSSNNIEMMIKMLDQGNANSAGQPTIAVLFGSATPLRIQLTITDTKTGTVKNYTSAFGSQAGSTDFTAFVK